MAIASVDELGDMIRARGSDLRAMGARSLSVFGSFARGEQDPSSDVDFLVEFEAGRKNFDTFIGLVFLLEEIVGRPVELLTRESLSPRLQSRILAEARDVPLGP